MSCFSPVRGTVIGRTDLLPQVYSPGAAGWTTTACKTVSPVSPGAHLIVLAIGESGMVGIGSASDPLPVGYPSASQRMFDKAYRCRTFTEPSHANTDAPVDSVQVEGALVPGIGPAGLFCWHLAQQTGSIVSLVPCAKGETLAWQWMPGQPLYVAAVRRAKMSMMCGGLGVPTLAYILVEQGLNDCNSADLQYLQWGDRWTTIEASLRSDLSFTGPLIYVRQHPTMLYSQRMIDAWPAFLAIQDAWEAPGRLKVMKPDGPWVDNTLHLATAAQIVLAERMAELIAT